MNRRHLIRALGAMTCAALVLAMTACGGGGGGSNSFTGNGGSAGGGTGSGSGSSGPPPLVITTTSLPDGIVNDPYRQAVTASGGSPPYRWAADGLFPTGLSLDASGNVTGTPPNSGGMTLGVIVTDSSSPPHTASAGVRDLHRTAANFRNDHSAQCAHQCPVRCGRERWADREQSKLGVGIGLIAARIATGESPCGQRGGYWHAYRDR